MGIYISRCLPRKQLSPEFSVLSTAPEQDDCNTFLLYTTVVEGRIYTLSCCNTSGYV